MDGCTWVQSTQQERLGGFYLLHVPVKGKIAPTLFPTEYFVKQKEDEE